MNQRCTREQFVAMIMSAAEQIKSNHAMLSKLDSAVGDGDHGAAMLKVVDAIIQVINENSVELVKPLLEKIAWAVMGVDGGSTGPLVGSFFSGMSSAIGEVAELDSTTISSMFVAGQEKVQVLTSAKQGDKTMIDALVPGVKSFVESIRNGQSLSDALREAATASAQGADDTKNMQAKFGRAKNLGDRTLGHIDPGAMSVSLLFQGFYKSVS